MKSSLGPLQTQDTVVIIGGGPAGAGCALKLKKLAGQKGIEPRIIVYEGKSFEKKSYYNQCLGVLSPPLEKIMEQDLGIPFPWPLIQRTIRGYLVHADSKILRLSGEGKPSYACRRVEFDLYLFEKMKQMNIEVIPARVIDLDFSRRGVMVYSESNNVLADVVVGAFGLDDGMAKVFERVTAYRQPKFLSSIVTKIHPGEEAMSEFGDHLRAFLPSSLPHVEFGAITPKGNHLSLNIAGKEVSFTMMDDFLDLPAVRNALPENALDVGPSLHYFKGKFPTQPAEHLSGERYVMVGDAAGLIRPFKGKGINSAIVTGIKAAEVIVRHGTSGKAFDIYLRRCHELTDDIPYGKILRFLTIRSSKHGLLDSVFQAVQGEPALKKAFFNIISGQETYKNIWHETRNLRLLVRFFLKTMSCRLSRK